MKTLAPCTAFPKLSLTFPLISSQAVAAPEGVSRTTPVSHCAGNTLDWNPAAVIVMLATERLGKPMLQCPAFPVLVPRKPGLPSASTTPMDTYAPSIPVPLLFCTVPETPLGQSTVPGLKVERVADAEHEKLPVRCGRVWIICSKATCAVEPAFSILIGPEMLKSRRFPLISRISKSATPLESVNWGDTKGWAVTETKALDTGFGGAELSLTVTESVIHSQSPTEQALESA